MKVYIVTYGEYDDYTVDKVFISEVLAVEYVNKQNEGSHVFSGKYEYYEDEVLESLEEEE